MKSLFIEKKVSKEKQKEYLGLFIDFGYRTALLTCDVSLIVELSGKSYAEVYGLPLGERIIIK